MNPQRGPGGRPAQANAAEAARAFEAELERRFDAMETQIEKLKVQFYRFFAGDLAKPPEDLREQIDREMRQLRSANLRRSADSFRLGAIEARLASYNEMFNRRLRNQEEGKAIRRGSAAPSAPRHDVETGVVVGARPAPDAVDALFQGLAARNQKAAMDVDTFRRYLETQVAQIRQKTGCESVQFRLVTEDGKVKLKAKPVSGPQP